MTLVKLPPCGPLSWLPVAAKPPATLDAPALTVPEACEFEMLAPLLKPSPNKQPWQFCMPEPGELPPTKPPAVLLSPVVTAPVADDDVIVPSLLPAKPPAASHIVPALPTRLAAAELDICP